MFIPIQALSSETFQPFGKLLRHTKAYNEAGPLYEKIHVAESSGWIWAIYSVRQRIATQLECHPNTRESFEPMDGTGVLLVAEPNQPDNLQAFILSEPVLLHEGVWHTLLSLTETTTVKIVENSEVETEFFELREPLKVGLSEA
jgi:ureidoglycolate hydrolase